MEVKEKPNNPQVVGPDPAYREALQRSVERYGPGLERSPIMNEHREFVKSMNGNGTIAAKKPMPSGPMK